jgi:hypothetical protein
MQPSDPYGQQPGQQVQPGYQPPQGQPPAQPAYPPQPAQNPGPQHDYSFITDPGKPPRKSLLPGASSLLGRVLLVVGGLLVLVIIFVIVRGALTGGSSVPAFVGIAQEQEELIHLTDGADKENSLNEVNQNFAITARLSLTSAQSELIQYMSKNGTTINAKDLGIKISATTDQKLTSAATNNTYNETFKTIMQTKLTEYQKDMQQLYADKATGKTGKALLDKDYAAAGLLIEQLNATAN